MHLQYALREGPSCRLYASGWRTATRGAAGAVSTSPQGNGGRCKRRLNKGESGGIDGDAQRGAGEGDGKAEAGRGSADRRREVVVGDEQEEVDALDP